MAAGRDCIRKGGRGRVGYASGLWRVAIALGWINSGRGRKKVGGKIWREIAGSCFDSGALPSNESYRGMVAGSTAELFDPFLESP
jgi:hypothetical protein